jgi:endoglycosylceramidase
MSAARGGAVLAVAALAILVAFTGQAAASLPALHVGDREIRDSHDRQVLLRGVNVTALSDQYQVDPNLPPVAPLHGRDYHRMEAMGFNVIRLAITWSRLEPKRGQISEHYIERIRKVVVKAANHGIYTVIDMHNGGWGKYVATPPGEKCRGDLRRSHGWLGAPEWATFLDGESTCHDEARAKKRTPAVLAAWDNFWDNHADPSWNDGAGIQDHLAGVWAALSRAFSHEPAVAGYDLLNEADPGNGDRDQAAYTARFDANAIAAIRQAETHTGGFSHMVFFEPNLTWSQYGLATRSPSPGFSSDPNLVFAPHIYGRDVHSTDRNIKRVRRDLFKQERRTARRARAYGSALWIGEWSFSIFDESALKKLRTHVRIQDSNQLGSAWWQWEVACGAPQRFDGLNPKVDFPVVGNLNPARCPSGKRVKRPKGFKALVARAYPRSSPGTLTKLKAHGSRISLAGNSKCSEALRASDPRACRLVVWIPKRTHQARRRPRVEAHHMRHVLVRHAPGGWLATADVLGGKYSLIAY